MTFYDIFDLMILAFMSYTLYFARYEWRPVENTSETGEAACV